MLVFWKIKLYDLTKTVLKVGAKTKNQSVHFHLLKPNCRFAHSGDLPGVLTLGKNNYM